MGEEWRQRVLGSNSADILGREREVTGLTDGLDVECEGKRGA